VVEKLFETNAGAWWLEAGSKSSVGRFLIHIDAQDAQDFSCIDKLLQLVVGNRFKVKHE